MVIISFQQGYGEVLSKEATVLQERKDILLPEFNKLDLPLQKKLPAAGDFSFLDRNISSLAVTPLREAELGLYTESAEAVITSVEWEDGIYSAALAWENKSFLNPFVLYSPTGNQGILGIESKSFYGELLIAEKEVEAQSRGLVWLGDLPLQFYSWFSEDFIKGEIRPVFPWLEAGGLWLYKDQSTQFFPHLALCLERPLFSLGTFFTREDPWSRWKYRDFFWGGAYGALSTEKGALNLAGGSILSITDYSYSQRLFFMLEAGILKRVYPRILLFVNSDPLEPVELELSFQYLSSSGDFSLDVEWAHSDLWESEPQNIECRGWWKSFSIGVGYHGVGEYSASLAYKRSFK